MQRVARAAQPARPASVAIQRAPAALRRSPAAPRAAANPVAPPIVHEVLASAGEPLSRPTRERMEAQFGHDFSRVRVHSDARAAASVEAVDARAYTVGHDVVFGAGEFAPETPVGRQLLAHELAHVTQNAGDSSSTAGRSIEIGAVDHPLERHAEAAARNVGGGSSNGVRSSAPEQSGPGMLFRDPKPARKFATPDEAILAELMKDIPAGDAKAAEDQLDRLRTIFKDVARSRAKALRNRLLTPSDTLAILFNRLEETARDELLEILKKKIGESAAKTTAPKKAKAKAKGGNTGGSKKAPFTVDEKIMKELLKKIDDSDASALEERRKRLRELCEGVSPQKARKLHARLSGPDTLGDVFRSELDRPTQDELLEILRKKSETPAVTTPSGAKEVKPTEAEEKDEAEKLAEVARLEKEIAGQLSTAEGLLKTAEGMIAGVESADLDADLVQLVKEQGTVAREHLELLIDLAPVLAGLPEEQRKVAMGAGAIELQLLIRNVEHLVVMKDVVSFEIPEEVSNSDEVEELLDEFASWHESWIEENDMVAELAGDVVDFTTGISEQLDINTKVAELFADYENRLQDQTDALQKVAAEIKSFQDQAKKIKDKSNAVAVIVFILSLRRGGVKGPKPRPRPRPPKGAKPKPKVSKKTKKRKEFRKPAKGAKKPSAKRGRKRKDKKKKKKDRKKALPICWPIQLGPPMLAGVPVPTFIRTPKAERDTQHAYQERLQLVYREKVDPGFKAKDFHVHHSVPLFLGGLDAAPINLTLVPARIHLRGHAILAHQPQLAKPIGGQQPPPGGADLYAHPAGTRYRLAGFKKDRNESCVK